MNDMLTSMTLLSAASATGPALACQRSGRYCFVVAGTFGGAVVGLQMLGPDGTTWIDVENDAGAIAITSAKALAVLLPAGKFRASVFGGAGTSLFATLNRMVD